MPGLFGNKFHKSEDSFSLRLNGFTKIGLCIALSIVTLVIDDAAALGILLLGSSIFALTQMRIKILGIVYLLVLLMGGLSMASAWGLAKVFGMGDYSLFTMVNPFMRILIVLQVVLVVALSTSPQEMLINLKSIKLPRMLYLPVLVMLRFIPSFINDLRQIGESLKTRGLRITPLSVLLHPVLTMRRSVFPLIFRAFRSSDELAIASELKGVGHYKNVTSFKKHSFKREDLVLILLAMLFIGSSLCRHAIAPEKLSPREQIRQSRTKAPEQND
jgi:energy-coupling factor transport system permease protein